MCIVLTADKRRNKFQPANIIIPHPSLDVTPWQAQLRNYSTPRIGGNCPQLGHPTKMVVVRLPRPLQYKNNSMHYYIQAGMYCDIENVAF